jgi:hypothetical protein
MALSTRTILSLCVQLWFEHGTRLDALLSKFSTLRAAIEDLETVPRRIIYLGEPNQAPLRLYLYGETPLPDMEAARLLVALATCDRVGRIKKCQRPGCGRIYLQADDRSNRYYCRRMCGNSAPRPSTSEKEHNRLQTAKALLSEVPTRARDKSGIKAQAWLKGRLLKGNTEVTLNYLTRRLKSGALSYPEWWTEHGPPAQAKR